MLYIVKFSRIRIWVFINGAKNNTDFFGGDYFNKSRS